MRFQHFAVFRSEAEHSSQCLHTTSLFVAPTFFRKGNIARINIEQQLRHIEPENSRSLLFTQTLLDAALTLERALLTMKLYREKSWFCVVFGSEDSTMDAKTQPLA